MAVVMYGKTYRGDDTTITVFVTQRGQPFNVTGCTFFFTAKRSPRDADAAAVVTLESGSGITIVNAAAGEIEIEVPSSTTDAMAPGDYWCDVQMKLPNGRIKTPGSIVWTILADTTRRTS